MGYGGVLKQGSLEATLVEVGVIEAAEMYQRLDEVGLDCRDVLKGDVPEEAHVKGDVLEENVPEGHPPEGAVVVVDVGQVAGEGLVANGLVLDLDALGGEGLLLQFLHVLREPDGQTVIPAEKQGARSYDIELKCKHSLYTC